MDEKTPQRFRDLFERAVRGVIHRRELEEESVHTRMRVVSTVMHTVRNMPGMLNSPIPEMNLAKIGESFDVSPAFAEWQDKRRQRLITELKSPAYKDLRAIFKEWDKRPLSHKQEALKQTSKMHLHSYMSGVGEILPVTHRFCRIPPKNAGGRIGYVFGGFTGNYALRRGRIRHNMDTPMFENDAAFVLETNHHETTHGLQFMLADACKRRVIRRDHPLHQEALMFYELDHMRAGIPLVMGRAYQAQIHERLAESEGVQISRDIMELIS